DQISRASRQLFEGPGSSEPLRVLAPATFAMQWLIPRLKSAGAPGFADQVDIRTTQTHEAWTKCPFDLAIRRGKDDCGAHESEPLWTEDLTLIAAPTVARRLGSQGLAAPADEPCVESASRPGELASWLGRAGLDCASLKLTRRFDHYYVTLHAIINGYGWGIGSLQV